MGYLLPPPTALDSAAPPPAPSSQPPLPEMPPCVLATGPWLLPSPCCPSMCLPLGGALPLPRVPGSPPPTPPQMRALRSSLPHVVPCGNALSYHLNSPLPTLGSQVVIGPAPSTLNSLQIWTPPHWHSCEPGSHHHLLTWLLCLQPPRGHAVCSAATRQSSQSQAAGPPLPVTTYLHGKFQHLCMTSWALYSWLSIPPVLSFRTPPRTLVLDTTNLCLTPHLCLYVPTFPPLLTCTHSPPLASCTPLFYLHSPAPTCAPLPTCAHLRPLSHLCLPEPYSPPVLT